MKILSRLLLLIVAAAWPVPLFATAQIPESLTMDGTEYHLAAEPLERYFTEQRPKPETDAISSACWRGYIATWEVRDDQLFITKLEPCHGGGDLWKKFFKDATAPLKADWYSGVLRLPEGERLEYIHMGYGSVYRTDHYLVIVEGKLVRRYEVENDFNSLSYRDRQRAELGHTDAPDGVEEPEVAVEISTEDWLDVMHLRRNFSAMQSEGGKLKVRAIFFDHQLFMPGNGAAPPMELRTDLAEGVEAPAEGSIVEATVGLSVPNRGTLVTIHEIIKLPDDAALDRRERVKLKVEAGE